MREGSLWWKGGQCKGLIGLDEKKAPWTGRSQCKRHIWRERDVRGFSDRRGTV